MAGGYAFVALFIAIQSGDQERIESWFAVTEPILNTMLADPKWGSIVGVFAWWLEYHTGLVEPTPATPDFDAMPMEDLTSIPILGLLGPTLAAVTPEHISEDRFFDYLEAMAQNGLWFSDPFGDLPFYREDWTYPDWVRRHPRYLALFDRPGLAELEAARRRNGQTVGLPIRGPAP